MANTKAIQAIPTEYVGITFRSRTEARWAMLLTQLGIQWQYEAEGYRLPSGEWYLPDFWLPDQCWFLEVKGVAGEGKSKARSLATGTGMAVAITRGNPTIANGLLMDGIIPPGPDERVVTLWRGSMVDPWRFKALDWIEEQEYFGYAVSVAYAVSEVEAHRFWDPK